MALLTSVFTPLPTLALSLHATASTGRTASASTLRRQRYRRERPDGSWSWNDNFTRDSRSVEWRPPRVRGDHAWVVESVVGQAAREHATLVKGDQLIGHRRDERHVVFDDEQRAA